MANDAHPFGIWQPWQPHEVARFFSILNVPWWIAGGWAIDLFIGTQTRKHDDIDIQVLRRDQQVIRALLSGWDVQEAHPTTPMSDWPFRSWEPGQPLRPGVHDVWCRPDKTAPWVLQLMIADTGDDRWLCRRDPRIHRPITTIGRQTSDGIPYLAPEIQLLYKAKAPRPKDEADFIEAIPRLNQQSRHWLAQAIALIHPDHPWLAQLENVDK
jgi:hypothetical protein